MDSKIKQDRRFDIHLRNGGGRLEAEWIDPGLDQLPTLVFLHEGLGCVELWRDVPTRLAEITGYGALVYSRLGYGRSDACPMPRPVDFMHHEGVTVLPEVLRQTGIRDYVLVGHSDGGSIALIHAGSTSCPGLVGVITLAAHVFCEDITRQSIASARERYLSGDLKTRLSLYHGENTHCAFRGWSDVWLHPDFRSWTIEPVLPAIRAPVLAIQGENDPYGSQAQIDVLRRTAGGQVDTAVISDCGHAPHLEKTDAVFAAISTFMTHRIDALR